MQNGMNILDLVPKGRLARYLDTTSAGLSMPVRLMDGSGARVMDSDGAAFDHAWENVRRVLDNAPAELPLPGGHSLMAAPVMHKGGILGYIAACKKTDVTDNGRAFQLLMLSASHLEAMADAGEEVESLTAEVVRGYEELALIYGLTGRLGAKVEINDICGIVAEEAVSVLNPTDVVVHLTDEQAGCFRAAFSSGAHNDLLAGFEPPLREGFIGRAYASRRPVLINEVDSHRHLRPWPFGIKMLMAVPLIADGKVVGMISVTDKRHGGEFDSREEKLLSAIASVAAIAIKNAQLYANIVNLLEGFLAASVTAVESRDPTTAGHSARVAAMAVELAKRVDESDSPEFSGVSFTREQLVEIRYAGLLHDFGKIGVREPVLLKARKLMPWQMERIKGRFGYIRELKKNEALEKKLDTLLCGGKEAYLSGCGRIDAELALELELLDSYLRAIESADEPAAEAGIQGPDILEEIARMRYRAPGGEDLPYLTPSELGDLKVPAGSLNEVERHEIEQHVMHSYNFLTKIPWTGDFRHIGDIVYSHHERLDGTGYPRGLARDDIPFQARIIAVADIFDALTASDRPYKKAVTVEQALFILESAASSGGIEPSLVRLFRDKEVYRAVSGMT
jgi:HD-GYP domain-containing protein (c-di-GMP phosphodiesterase class II)